MMNKHSDFFSKEVRGEKVRAPTTRRRGMPLIRQLCLLTFSHSHKQFYECGGNAFIVEFWRFFLASFLFFFFSRAHRIECFVFCLQVLISSIPNETSFSVCLSHRNYSSKFFFHFTSSLFVVVVFSFSAAFHLFAYTQSNGIVAK